MSPHVSIILISIVCIFVAFFLLITLYQLFIFSIFYFFLFSVSGLLLTIGLVVGRICSSNDGTLFFSKWLIFPDSSPSSNYFVAVRGLSSYSSSISSWAAISFTQSFLSIISIIDMESVKRIISQQEEKSELFPGARCISPLKRGASSKFIETNRAPL